MAPVLRLSSRVHALDRGATTTGSRRTTVLQRRPQGRERRAGGSGIERRVTGSPGRLLFVKALSTRSRTAQGGKKALCSAECRQIPGCVYVEARAGGAVSIASRGSASSELGGIFAEDVFAKVKLVHRLAGQETTRRPFGQRVQWEAVIAAFGWPIGFEVQFARVALLF